MMPPMSLTEDEKNRIINKFLPKIKYWVLRIKSGLPDVVDIDELYSAAYLGLIESLNNYVQSRAATFDIYAEKRIKGSIMDALRKLDHLPRNVRSSLKKLEEDIGALSKKIGRKPTYEEIIEHTEYDKKFLDKYLNLLENEHVNSLDAPVSDEAGTNLVDLVKSYIDAPDVVYEKNELIKYLGAQIDMLPEKERLVIVLYYYEELTMKEIGIIMEVTESRVSQLHSTAVNKLRKSLGDIFG
jgi:RNA polymerase sigma factor for flagellar operon FliA